MLQFGKDFDSVCNRAVKVANALDGGLEMAEDFIIRAGWGHSIFGVEHCEVTDGDDLIAEMDYLNVGDTYDLTVCEEDGKCFSSSWGDWYESAEQGWEEQEGVIRCACCSAFTPVSEQWNETICESCGNNVNGG